MSEYLISNTVKSSEKFQSISVLMGENNKHVRSFKTIVVNTKKAKYYVVLCLLEFCNKNEKWWLVADCLACDTFFESKLVT